MINRKTLLLFWLLGMLAPMAWIARHIPGYDAAFAFVFGPAWMHWVSHAFLFGVLAFLLLTLLMPGGEMRWPRLAVVLGVVLVAAFLQEAIQLAYKRRAWGGDEWFDLGVDMIGAWLGAVAWFALSRRGHALPSTTKNNLNVTANVLDFRPPKATKARSFSKTRKEK